jgi:hypothetical protein
MKRAAAAGGAMPIYEIRFLNLPRIRKFCVNRGRNCPAHSLRIAEKPFAGLLEVFEDFV